MRRTTVKKRHHDGGCYGVQLLDSTFARPSVDVRSAQVTFSCAHNLGLQARTFPAVIYTPDKTCIFIQTADRKRCFRTV